MATIPATDNSRPSSTGHSGSVKSIVHVHPDVAHVTVEHDTQDEFGNKHQSMLHVPADHAAKLRVGDRVRAHIKKE